MGQSLPLACVVLKKNWQTAWSGCARCSFLGPRPLPDIIVLHEGEPRCRRACSCPHHAALSPPVPGVLSEGEDCVLRGMQITILAEGWASIQLAPALCLPSLQGTDSTSSGHSPRVRTTVSSQRPHNIRQSSGAITTPSTCFRSKEGQQPAAEHQTHLWATRLMLRGRVPT